MIKRFCLYGFLKNQQYYDPFLILAFRDRGLSFAAIGLLIGFRELCINVMEIPTGALADTFGRRLSMILSHVSYIVAFVVFALAGNLAWLFPAMFCYATGEAFRTGTHKAIIFDWLRQQGRASEKTQVYGITRSWSQIGSALSVVIAAALVFAVGDYSLIFWLSIIPSAANIVNFLTYPKSLDGLADPNGERPGLRILALTFWGGLRQSLTRAPLRRMLAESMGFEGAYKVAKDYLQPIIKATALALPLLVGFDDIRRGAVLVGAVYVVLYLLNSGASRQAGRFAARLGGDRQASDRLWQWNAGAFAIMAVAMLAGVQALAIVAFLVLAVLQNLWRPLLVARVADFAEARQMATVLSVESQGKTLFAALAAPLVGWMVDAWFATSYLPAALLGLAVSGWAIATRPVAERQG